MLGDGRRSPAPSVGRRLPDPVQVWEEAPLGERAGRNDARGSGDRPGQEIIGIVDLILHTTIILISSGGRSNTTHQHHQHQEMCHIRRR